jgi:predicted RecA/RadA family phage recombinase
VSVLLVSVVLFVGVGLTTGFTFGSSITSGEVVLVGFELSGYVTDDTTAPSIAAGNDVYGNEGAVGLLPVHTYSKTWMP